MRILVTGSAGHLGEALVRVLRADGRDVVGLDILASPYTDIVGSIADRALSSGARRRRRRAARRHAAQAPRRLARRQEFVDTNITGTLNLLQEAVAARRRRVRLHEHHERVRPRADAAARRAGGVDHRGRRAGPAQHLRRHEDRGRGPLRARPPRPRPAVPDPAHVALLPRGRRPRRGPRRLRGRQPQGQRAAVPARRPRGRRRARTGCALERAPELGFGRYIISATTPFTRDDLAGAARRRAGRRRAATSRVRADLRRARLADVRQHRARLRQRAGARRARLGARATTSRHALERLARGEDPRSELALAVGAKGYHAVSTGVYTMR